MGDLLGVIFGGSEEKQTSVPVSSATLDPDLKKVRGPLADFLAGQAPTGFRFPEYPGRRTVTPSLDEPAIAKIMQGIMRQFSPDIYGQAGRTISEQMETGFAGDVQPYLRASEDVFQRRLDRSAADMRNMFGGMGQRYGSELGESEALFRSDALAQFMPQMLQASLGMGEAAAGRRASAAAGAPGIAGAPLGAGMGFETGYGGFSQQMLDRLTEDYYKNLQGYLPYATGFGTSFPPVANEFTGTARSGEGITPLLQAAAFMAGKGVFGKFGGEDKDGGDGWGEDLAGAGVGAAASLLPFLFSSREFKEDIELVSVEDEAAATKAIRETPIYRWRYKSGLGLGTDEHIGPVTEEAPSEIVTEDKSRLDLISVAGLSLAAIKDIDRRVSILERR